MTILFYEDYNTMNSSANSNTNGNSLVANKICKNCIIVSTIGKTKLPDIITCKNNLGDVKCQLIGSIVIK